MGVSGINAYLNWGEEGSFKGGATTSRTFGHGTKITSIDRGNNLERLFGLGSRNATVIKEGRFTGSLGVEFALSSPWFLKGVFGAVTTSQTASPYTYTFTESDTIPYLGIENGIDLTTDYIVDHNGAFIDKAVISCAQGETAKVRLTIPYAAESYTTAAISSQVAETFDVMHFAYGALEMPDGSPLASVQNAEVTISNAVDIHHGLGSRVGSTYTIKERTYDIRFSLIFDGAAAALTYFYTGAASATGPATNTAIAETTLELVFDNGLATTLQRKISLVFAGVKINTESLPQDPTAVIIEECTAWARSCVATAITGTTYG